MLPPLRACTLHLTDIDFLTVCLHAQEYDVWKVDVHVYIDDVHMNL